MAAQMLVFFVEECDDENTEDLEDIKKAINS